MHVTDFKMGMRVAMVSKAHYTEMILTLSAEIARYFKVEDALRKRNKLLNLELRRLVRRCYYLFQHFTDATRNHRNLALRLEAMTEILRSTHFPPMVPLTPPDQVGGAVPLTPPEQGQVVGATDSDVELDDFPEF